MSYYEARKDRIRAAGASTAQARAWKQANPDRVKASYNRCKEEYNARRRERYRTNPSKRETLLAWRKANPELVKLYKRKSFVLRKYGMQWEDFLKMWKLQKGNCVICGLKLRAGKLTHVDHIHGTDYVRGILCNTCNMGIGYFKDSPALLREAAQYVETRKPKKAIPR